MNRPVFLIGYMGSGKSSLGRQLAREMQRDFIDLDKYIEARFHLTVKQIFDEIIARSPIHKLTYKVSDECLKDEDNFYNHIIRSHRE